MKGETIELKETIHLAQLERYNETRFGDVCDTHIRQPRSSTIYEEPEETETLTISEICDDVEYTKLTRFNSEYIKPLHTRAKSNLYRTTFRNNYETSTDGVNHGDRLLSYLGLSLKNITHEHSEISAQSMRIANHDKPTVELSSIHNTSKSSKIRIPQFNFAWILICWMIIEIMELIIFCFNILQYLDIIVKDDILDNLRIYLKLLMFVKCFSVAFVVINYIKKRIVITFPEYEENITQLHLYMRTELVNLLTLSLFLFQSEYIFIQPKVVKVLNLIINLIAVVVNTSFLINNVRKGRIGSGERHAT